MDEESESEVVWSFQVMTGTHTLHSGDKLDADQLAAVLDQLVLDEHTCHDAHQFIGGTLPKAATFPLGDQANGLPVLRGDHAQPLELVIVASAD